MQQQYSEDNLFRQNTTCCLMSLFKGAKIDQRSRPRFAKKPPGSVPQCQKNPQNYNQIQKTLFQPKKISSIKQANQKIKKSISSLKLKRRASSSNLLLKPTQKKKRQSSNVDSSIFTSLQGSTHRRRGQRRTLQYGHSTKNPINHRRSNQIGYGIRNHNLSYTSNGIPVEQYEYKNQKTRRSDEQYHYNDDHLNHQNKYSDSGKGNSAGRPTGLGQRTNNNSNAITNKVHFRQRAMGEQQVGSGNLQFLQKPQPSVDAAAVGSKIGHTGGRSINQQHRRLSMEPPIVQRNSGLWSGLRLSNDQFNNNNNNFTNMLEKHRYSIAYQQPQKQQSLSSSPSPTKIELSNLQNLNYLQYRNINTNRNNNHNHNSNQRTFQQQQESQNERSSYINKNTNGKHIQSFVAQCSNYDYIKEQKIRSNDNSGIRTKGRPVQSMLFTSIDMRKTKKFNLLQRINEKSKSSIGELDNATVTSQYEQQQPGTRQEKVEESAVMMNFFNPSPQLRCKMNLSQSNVPILEA